MTIALVLAGILILVVSVIAGIYVSSFFSVLIGIVCGIIFALILFALAKILDNQETILKELYLHNQTERKLLNSEQKNCLKCGHSHDRDYTSCPNCGYRE